MGIKSAATLTVINNHKTGAESSEWFVYLVLQNFSGVTLQFRLYNY